MEELHVHELNYYVPEDPGNLECVGIRAVA